MVAQMQTPCRPPHPVPKIAITVGDAAGIGPEVAVRSLSANGGNRPLTDRCRPILYGPAGILHHLAEKFEIHSNALQIRDIGDLSRADVTPGTFTAATGRASFDAVAAAIDDALFGTVDAVVTGPIQKEAWRTAGIAYPGHTEMLADRTGTDRYAMMLAGDSLACILVTIHIPLADVPAALTTEAIVQTIHLARPVAAARHRTKHSGRRSGSSSGSGSSSRSRPVIAVCGLNPHAGENGLMSHREEEQIIAPAIAASLTDDRNIDVLGPLSPDTAFTPAMRDKIDVYVCMYHDQGLIPLKCLEFDHGINVTLGLPIIRTSVDHGTAMDLAWRGTASTGSMTSAINAAIDMVQSKSTLPQ